MKRYGFKFVDVATTSKWTPEVRFFVVILSFLAPAISWSIDHELHYGVYVPVCFLCIFITMLADVLSAYFLGVLVCLGVSVPFVLLYVSGREAFTDPAIIVFTVYSCAIALIATLAIYIHARRGQNNC